MIAQLELTQKPFIELQIETLVQENRIKPKRVNKFILELKERLKGIKELNYNKLLLNRTFRLPLIGRPNSLNDDDYPKNAKFIPPEEIHVVGGFKTSTALKNKHFVDLAVCIPAECFEKKDIKNQRYQHKRALYLAQLAHFLNGSTGLGLVDKLEYRFYQGDYLKPLVLITPKKPKMANVVFQLFAYPHPDSPIKTNLLNPLHGNVAPKWFYKDYNFNSLDSNLKEFIESDSDVAQSPFYNSSILFDMELVSNSDVLSEQIGSQTSITEALVLTKVWLYQRELDKHFSFILSMFIAYLQTKQKIHQNMSSYQIFKVVMKSLIETDWADTGLSYFDDSKEKISTFKTVFPIVFLSPSGHLNLCYNITIDLYNRLKHEAKLAQDIFTSHSPDIFELLFLKKLDFVKKFDVIVHLPKCTKKFPEKLDYMKTFMDHGIYVPRIHSQFVLDVVQKALTDRVILVQQNVNHLILDRKWNLKSIPYDPTNQDSTFTFGLLLEAEKSLRIIDVGPEAQSDDAEEFRQFWEPKTQLRLQNGLISETVVWHVESFSQRRAIIKYILTHALKRVNMNNVVVHYTLLERFINLHNVFFKWRDDISDETIQNGNGPKKRKLQPEVIGKPIGVGEEIFQKVLHGYNELNKVLRNVENLKYPITSIQPTSHHLRASGVFPPLPVSLQTRNKSLKRRKGVTLFPEDFNQVGKILYLEPIEILVTLDSTNKWPNKYDAIQTAKLDYLIQLGESLKEKEYSVKFSDDHLDVLHGQFVFRIRIKCQKEMGLIQAAIGKQEFQRKRLELEVLPRVHAALDQLYREKPAFGLTCRLVKRWISCHLMTDHISDIALDLIVAHLFLYPQPYTEPASSLCGFHRFLMLMAGQNWQEQVLVVNFDDQLKLDEISRIKNTVLEERSRFPPLVICTPFDKDQSPWTKKEPTSDKLDLLSRVCTKALQFFEKQIISHIDVMEECKALFRPNFKMFDLLIKLHPHVSQTFFMSIDMPKNFKLVGKEPNGKNASALVVMPIVGLNVIEEYVNVLRTKYDNIASFFYDKYGQRIVGVLMKPDSEKLLDSNINGFMRDMKKLGAKLVESVIVIKREGFGQGE